jgi:hypothetical protein
MANNKLVWKKNVPIKVRKQAQVGMIDATNKMFNRSQHYAPFDDGELTSRGARISSEGEGTDHFVTCISYGNDPISAQYAVIQHENLVYHHTAPERAKYLETAFTEESTMVQYYIANRMKF